jgi:hypothetical protein
MQFSNILFGMSTAAVIAPLSRQNLGGGKVIGSAVTAADRNALAQDWLSVGMSVGLAAQATDIEGIPPVTPTDDA